MTTPPRMNLPDSAMPWGRWAQGEAQSAETALQRMAQDAHSAGSQFSSRVDGISRQIYGLGAFTMSILNPPDFTGTVSGSGNPNAWEMELSSTYTVNPPNTGIRSCLVIADFVATASSGDVPDIPVMKVNGNLFNITNNLAAQPGPIFTGGWYSVMGTVPLGPGESVTVQYGLKAAPLAPATFSVNSANIWFAFFGGLT